MILHNSGTAEPIAADPVFTLMADNSLYEQTGSTRTLLSPAGTILSISSVTDYTGQAIVYAVASDHHLWKYTPAGWAFVSSFSFQQINAVVAGSGHANVYAVLTDHSLWQSYNPFTGTWSNLSPAGTILSASAVTDGYDETDVFAVTSDSHLWEYKSFSGWSMLSSGSFQSISAGLNGNGAAVVYGVLTDNSLWENNPAIGGNGWVNLSPAGTILSVSAAGYGEAFAITADHHLWQHASSGWSLTSTGSFASLSGENNYGTDEVFAVLADASLWEYQLPNMGTPTWNQLDANGVLAASGPRHA